MFTFLQGGKDIHTHKHAHTHIDLERLRTTRTYTEIYRLGRQTNCTIKIKMYRK